MEICSGLCEIHPELDRDLVITGACLHDLGKIKEFEVSGGVIDVSHEGMMVGHIIIGYEILSNKINGIPGFPRQLGLKLLHIILSHHGKREWGSPVLPQTPEAMLIHCCDQLSATMRSCFDAVQQRPEGQNWTDKLYIMDDPRRLFVPPP